MAFRRRRRKRDAPRGPAREDSAERSRELDFEQAVAAMAADPEVQRENRRISHEFAATDGDGLED